MTVSPVKIILDGSDIFIYRDYYIINQNILINIIITLISIF
jgi:hypothetical protein